MKIAVDFDGTIVEHRYPYIGKEKPFAVETLKLLASEGHQLILWTARSGDLLQDAIKWCSERGLSFYSVNSNRPGGSLFKSSGDTSPKVAADVFIDDANLGGIPDWGEIYRMLSCRDDYPKHKTTHRKKQSWLKKLLRHWR